MIQWFILATVMKLLWLILTMLVTIDLLSIFRLTPHHCHLIAGHLVLIVIWKKMFETFYGFIAMLKIRVTSVGSVRCSHHKVQLKTILEPSLLQRQSGAWQTIQNVIETNIDARKYKWIASIKVNLLARFRCCMWTSHLRKEKLVTFNLQTLKPSSILWQWQPLILSITLDIK